LAIITLLQKKSKKKSDREITSLAHFASKERVLNSSKIIKGF